MEIKKQLSAKYGKLIKKLSVTRHGGWVHITVTLADCFKKCECANKNKKLYIGYGGYRCKCCAGEYKFFYKMNRFISDNFEFGKFCTDYDDQLKPQFNLYFK